MIVSLFAAGLLLVPPANAFWRLPCSKPVLNARVDPIINPGGPSGHSHTIMGSNAIGFDTTFEDLRNSNCSTCQVKDDKSAYWTPQLFYEHANGSFEAVPHGGMLIYYLQRGAANETVEAFPDGLRMFAGNPMLRSNPNNQESQAISWLCINLNGPAVPQTPGFSNTNCPDGLRAQVFFPSCWDGVNLDSPDHKSHMAYPDGIDNGLCPPSHPHHLVSLFYEVWFSPTSINRNGDGRFVVSTGDPTGYSLHGDFMNGWDQSVLSRAVKTCTAQSGVIEDCPVFQNEGRFYTGDENNACSAPNPIPKEDPNSGVLLPNLPGCIAVTDGPANATSANLVPGCVAAANGNGTAAPASSVSVPAKSAAGPASASQMSPSPSGTAPPASTSTPLENNRLVATTLVPASTFTTDLAAASDFLQGASAAHTGMPARSSAAAGSAPSKSASEDASHDSGSNCERSYYPRREYLDTLFAHRRRNNRRHCSRLHN